MTGASIDWDWLAKGARATVHPHGMPELAWGAVIEVVASSHRALGLRFPDPPPWAPPGVREAYKPATLALIRFEYGPWFDVFTGQHWEIEPVQEKGPVP